MHSRTLTKYKQLRYKTVPHTSYRNNMGRLLPVLFDFSPEPVDIDHNGVVINGYGGAPDLLIDHILCIDLSGMLDEQQEEGAFLRGQDPRPCRNAW